MKRLRILLAPLLVCVIATVALAQSGGGYDQSWSTVASGGGTSTGGAYTIQGTIGQHDAAGPLLRGAKHDVRSGFWAPPQESTTKTYLPLIVK